MAKPLLPLSVRRRRLVPNVGSITLFPAAGAAKDTGVTTRSGSVSPLVVTNGRWGVMDSVVALAAEAQAEVRNNRIQAVVARNRVDAERFNVTSGQS